MSERSVTSLKSFVFRHDFEQPSAQTEPAQISMTSAALTEALSAARHESVAENDRQYAASIGKVQTAAAGLEQALAQILELAEHLDRAMMDPGDRLRARNLMSSACQLIVDGQGDLFDLPASTNR